MNSAVTEIISVGTELLLGHVTNTDARDISGQLSKLGINVLYHTVVGDNYERLCSCIEIAKSRADIIITTGGLGPTCDDIAKQCLCDAFGLALVMNESERDGLYDFITLRKNFTENNLKQAMLPEGCTVFHNTCGTAPGCAFQCNGKTVVMLPGPPKECLKMLELSVLPYLRVRFCDSVIVSHTLCIFGLAESAVDSLFGTEMNAMVNPSMAPYANECDCLLKITAKASNTAAAESMILPVLESVSNRLGDYVYGRDVSCIEEAVVPHMLSRKLSIAIAEDVATGGDVCRRFCSVTGASACFSRGLIDTLLTPDNAESAAEDIRLSSGSDIGISVTGLDGNITVALSDGHNTFLRRAEAGDFRGPAFLARMAGNHAFDMLRRYLCGLRLTTD